jgi:hypothetical protein
MKKREYTMFALAIVVLAAIPAAFINFPPGDSWTQAWTVQKWLEGNFVINDWSSTLALPQQILGWLVNKGQESVSFSSLSILTAVVTVLGIVIAAKLPSRLFPQWPALDSWAPLIVIVALAPPFALKVAAGFMTDGYYLLFMTSALWFLVGALQGPGGEKWYGWVRMWIGFAALATLASLQRTHGLVLLIVVVIWAVFAKMISKDGKDERWSGWRGWFAVAMCVLAFVLSFVIMADPNLKPARSIEVQHEVISFWTGRTIPITGMLIDRIKLVFGILVHFGFALLPVALIARLDRTAMEKKAGKAGKNWWYVAGGTFFMIILLVLIGNQEIFPYLGNSVTAEGFGPRTDTIALTAGHKMNEVLRIALTIVGAVGGMVLIWLLSRSVRFRGIDWRAPSTLIGLLGLAHLGLVFLNPNFFDRYLLPLIPFAFCWLAPFLKDAPPKARKIGWAIVLVFLAWSVWGTADYLDWTKAKWDLAAELRAQGLKPNEMIAGYEADGYFNFSNERYNEPNNIYESSSVRELGIPWWITKLNLAITPTYVIFESNSETLNTPWKGSGPIVISNDRMTCMRSPDEMFHALMFNTMSFAQ